MDFPLEKPSIRDIPRKMETPIIMKDEYETCRRLCASIPDVNGMLAVFDTTKTVPRYALRAVKNPLIMIGSTTITWFRLIYLVLQGIQWGKRIRLPHVVFSHAPRSLAGTQKTRSWRTNWRHQEMTSRDVLDWWMRILFLGDDPKRRFWQCSWQCFEKACPFFWGSWSGPTSEGLKSLVSGDNIVGMIIIH